MWFCFLFDVYLLCRVLFHDISSTWDSSSLFPSSRNRRNVKFLCVSVSVCTDYRAIHSWIDNKEMVINKSVCASFSLNNLAFWLHVAFRISQLLWFVSSVPFECLGAHLVAVYSFYSYREIFRGLSEKKPIKKSISNGWKTKKNRQKCVCFFFENVDINRCIMWNPVSHLMIWND